MVNEDALLDILSEFYLPKIISIIAIKFKNNEVHTYAINKNEMYQVKRGSPKPIVFLNSFYDTDNIFKIGKQPRGRDYGCDVIMHELLLSNELTLKLLFTFTLNGGDTHIKVVTRNNDESASYNIAAYAASCPSRRPKPMGVVELFGII